MKGSKFFYKAVMMATVISAATLIGCGGSSRTPVSVVEVDIAGTLGHANLAREASANPQRYTAVAVEIGTNNTRTGTVSNAGIFSLRLDRSKNWAIFFVCQACPVKTIKLKFGASNGLYLSKLNGSAVVANMGTITPPAPLPGQDTLDGSPTNDPTTQAIWGANNVSFAVYKTTDVTVAQLEAAYNTAVAAAAAVGGVTGIDNTAPTVTGVTPAPGSSYPKNIVEASATFSELMQENTTPAVTVTITNTTTGSVVQAAAAASSIGTVSWSKVSTGPNTQVSVLNFTLTNGKTMDSGNNYRISLSFGGGINAIKDLAGNTLNLSGTGTGITVNAATQTIEIAFSVVAADTTAPTVVSTSPAANGTVSVNTTSGSVTFSEAMKTQLASATVTVANLTSAVTVVSQQAATSKGTLAWSTDNKTLTFNLTGTQRFNAGQQYSVSLVLDGFEDVAGNDLSTTMPQGLTGVNLTGNTLSYTFTAQ